MLPIFAYCHMYEIYPSLPIEYIPLKHLKADEVSYFIQNIHLFSDKDGCYFEKSTKRLIIQDKDDCMRKYQQFIKNMDKPINPK